MDYKHYQILAITKKKTQIALSKGYGKGSEKKEEKEQKIKIDEVIMNR